MKSSDHGYFAALTYDLRVRERLIAAGVVTQADIDRYLGEIPELEAHAENLGIPQPAVGGGGGSIAAAAAPAPAPVVSAPIAAVSAPAPSPASLADGEASTDDDDDEDGEP
jgi:hypothetical protein